MGIAKNIARGLKHLERGLEEPTFEWDGNAYPCTTNTKTAGTIFGPGGPATVDTGILFVRKAVLPDPGPDVDDLITVDGKQFRIDQIDTLPGQPAIRITYNDPNRGA